MEPRKGMDDLRAILHRLSRINEMTQRRRRWRRLFESQPPEVGREGSEPRAGVPESCKHGERGRRIRSDDFQKGNVCSDGFEDGCEDRKVLHVIDESDFEGSERWQRPALALQKTRSIVQILQVLYCWQMKTSTYGRNVFRGKECSNLEVREPGPRWIEVVEHHILSWVLMCLYFAMGGD